jgi:glycosyltransferase involved in cell wall biosynthesis
MNLIVDNLAAVQSGNEREVKFLLEAAVERHQNGQLAAANLIYQEIRKIDPDNINALQLSGVLAYQVQQYDASISLLSRVISLKPDYEKAFYNRGLSFQQLGRFEEALADYNTAISLKPDYVDALNNRGITLQQLGRFEEASTDSVQEIDMAHISIDLDNVESLENVKSSLEIRKADPKVILLIDILLLLRKDDTDEFLSSFKTWISLENIPEDNFWILLTAISKIEEVDKLRFVLKETRKSFFKLLFEQKVIKDIPKFFDCIGFNRATSKEKIMVLGDEIVSVAVNEVYSLGLIEIGFFLEQLYYNNFITRFETDDAFKHGMNKISNSIEAAGSKIYKILNPSKVNEFEHYNNPKPLVGFFFHNASMLAHIESIFIFLKSLIDDKNLQFKPIIFCMAGRNSAFSQAFASIGVEIVYLDTDRNGNLIPGNYKRILRLREECMSREIDKLIWGCLATFMLFAFSLKIAPEQIWWSQKWTGLSSRSVDKSIHSFTPKLEQKINGDKWLGGWFQRSNWLNNVDEREVQKIRKYFNGKLLLGSLARSEKMNDVRFLSTLTDILKMNENILFLWTGREEEKFISRFFDEKNVKHKTKFVGWVNTSLYAQVLDVLLDSFPTGNGITAIQAMEAGTPVVTMRSRGDVRTWDQFIGPAMEPGSVRQGQILEVFCLEKEKQGLYFCAEDHLQYIEMANRLIRDPVLRERVGKAGERFVELMMKNPIESSKIFQEHVLRK